MDNQKIDVSALREEERCDMARLLFKCGYTVEPRKEKAGNKSKNFIIIRKVGNA
jgi:hypothetical protein